jgi:hypothetical protein
MLLYNALLPQRLMMGKSSGTMDILCHYSERSTVQEPILRISISAKFFRILDL